MNIFVTSPSPRTSALCLDDKRKNSQIRESVQLLSNAIGNPEGAYRSTHQHHPCSIWVASSPANFCWLYDHTLWLGTFWGGFEDPLEMAEAFVEDPLNVHGSIRVLLGVIAREAAETINGVREAPLSFQNSARNGELGVDFTDRPTVFESYRDYLNYRWNNTDKNPSWKKGVRPVWA